MKHTLTAADKLWFKGHSILNEVEYFRINGDLGRFLNTTQPIFDNVLINLTHLCADSDQVPHEARREELKDSPFITKPFR